ncbi:MAG: hypothetical protein Q9160_003414 [Pyrenula sp. 1 TL-2023]
MPVIYSKLRDPALADQVLWVDDYVSLERHGLLSAENRKLGFRTYISESSGLLRLSPEEYLQAFKENFHDTIPATPIGSFLSNIDRNPFAYLTGTLSTGGSTRSSSSSTETIRGFESDDTMPTLQINGLDATTVNESDDATNPSPTRPALTTRKSSTMHQNIMKKLRPMPFQYKWAVWHDKATSDYNGTMTSNSNTSAESYSNRLTLLSDEVPDIAAFYRIYNHFPWDRVKVKDSVHVFRQGVKPLWEDHENRQGGGLTVKVKREEGKAVRAWEEVCLLGCGGELQAAVLPGKQTAISSVIVEPIS